MPHAVAMEMYVSIRISSRGVVCDVGEPERGLVPVRGAIEGERAPRLVGRGDGVRLRARGAPRLSPMDRQRLRVRRPAKLEGGGEEPVELFRGADRESREQRE